MEAELRKGFSEITMSRALDIYHHPKDCCGDRFRILAMRYIFQHKNKTKQRNCPDRDKLIEFGFKLFDDCKNSEMKREIADIIHTFSPTGEILLQRLRQREQEQEEYDEQKTVINNKKHVKTVYEDSQNVHNSKINNSVLKVAEELKNMFKEFLGDLSIKNDCINNIRRILMEKYPNSSIVENSITYIKNSIATFGNNGITMIDVFISVWLWISEHKEREELEKRLLEELKEMDKMCTTGHLARLINVIQGFTDDERLCVRISNKDQCKAVIKQYLTNALMNCQDEKILEEMSSEKQDKEAYIKFIRKSISLKLLDWEKEYGKDILSHIAEVTNTFAGTIIFEK
jgi:hypothetical protein